MERYRPSPKNLRIFYVYIIFRLNGIPCYVGKGKGNRWKYHESHTIKNNSHFRSIVLQAKKANKELPKIKLRENLTEDEAFALEIIFIKAIGREKHGGPLVNLTDGGEGPVGLVLSEKSRKQISAGKIGIKLPPQHCANISKGSTGKKKSFGWWSTEEGRNKQRLNNPPRPQSKEDRARSSRVIKQYWQTWREAKAKKNVSAPPL